MLIIYEILLALYVLVSIPLAIVKNKWHKGLAFRLGFIPEEIKIKIQQKENIWLHAVSVGEVVAISALIHQLHMRFPRRQIVLTVSTKTGHELALRKLSHQALVLWSPLDFGFSVMKFINLIKPVIYVVAETELWPNLFYRLNQTRVPIILINGRISDASLARYRNIRWFMKRFLNYVTVFCMQSDEDAKRIESLGAPHERIKNVGNVKFDELPGETHASILTIGFQSSDRLWVAGSTHPGEEEIVLRVYKEICQKYPDLRLVIVPRHVERSQEISGIIKAQGLSPVLFSQRSGQTFGQEHVLLVDEIGHLKDLYRLSSVVFVGKSLTVQGGHNVIEPAFFAKPIIVGPHMQNFRDVMAVFLKDKAILQVPDEAGLKLEVERLFGDLKRCQDFGDKARAVIEHQKGATQKTVNEIALILQGQT